MDVLPRLPSDIVRAAFPEEPTPEWLLIASKRDAKLKGDRSAVAEAMRFLKEADPHYYNSLVERHTKNRVRAKPVAATNVKRKGGLIADDGTVYVHKSEKMEGKKAQRIIEEREAKLAEIVTRENERLEHLRQAIRSGNVIYTPEGIFEIRTCRGCGSICQKVQLDEKPCPGSIMASNLFHDATKSREAAHAQTKLVDVKVSNTLLEWKTTVIVFLLFSVGAIQSRSHSCVEEVVECFATTIYCKASRRKCRYKCDNVHARSQTWQEECWCQFCC